MRKKNNTDGTPAVRFDWLMSELDKRFPSSNPHLSSHIPELEYLMAIDAVIRDSKELNAAKMQVFNMFTGVKKGERDDK